MVIWLAVVLMFVAGWVARSYWSLVRKDQLKTRNQRLLQEAYEQGARDFRDHIAMHYYIEPRSTHSDGKVDVWL